MPRYFFHHTDDERASRDYGVELPDEEAARSEAIRYAGEVLSNDPGNVWRRGMWRIEVTDPGRFLLFAVAVIGMDAPRPTAA